MPLSLPTVSFKVIYAADRHAKKELKKQVRGVRAIERSVANSDNQISETVQGYCLAVRSALTDDGRPPLEASGLKLRERLTLTLAKPRTGDSKGGLIAGNWLS